MCTEIYYFSSTGNSLHVARELQKRLPDTTLVPIVSLLHKQNIQTKAQNAGFVFPLYFTTVPAPVRYFCEKISLNCAEYIFSVVTRLGTFSVANLGINRILRKKGKSLDAAFILNMAQNSHTGLAPGLLLY